MTRERVARGVAWRPREALAAGRPASVLVALIDGPGEVAVVLTRRPAAMREHGGQYAFPGGRRDPGEGAVDAALREAREELGVDPAAVEVVGLLDDRLTSTDYAITPVVGWIPHGYPYAPNPGEVELVVELPLRAFFAPSRARTLRLATHRRVALGWDIDGHHVWGATAGVLRDLTARLSAAG